MFFFSRKLKTIRGETVKAAAGLVQEYASWYQRNGLSLPPKYAHDPSGWTNALNAMAKSFRLLQEDIDGYGEYYDAKHKYDWSWDLGKVKIWEREADEEAVKDLEEEINKGLVLFGENLLYLTDIPKDD